MRTPTLTLVLLLLLPVSAATQLDAPRIVNAARDAVVSLIPYDARGAARGIGSGFLLEDGRIVTNRHVVEEAERVEVFGRDERFLGEVKHAEGLSPEADLAILPAPGTVPATLRLASREPEVGEAILVIGAPKGLTHTVADGLVSAYRELYGERLMQISAPISQGSSGGPVLNAQGEVVGVSTAVLLEGQNLNFAVPVSRVHRLASAPGQHLAFPRRTTTGAATAASAEVPLLDFEGPVTGTLEPDDRPTGAEHAADGFLFEGRSGQVLSLTLRSDDFDALLLLLEFIPGEDRFVPLATDDDGAGDTHAHLRTVLPRDGMYLVMVGGASPEALGRYTLEASQRAERWRTVAERSGEVVSYDGERLERTPEGVVFLWVRHDYERVQPLGELVEGYDRSISRLEVDCAGMRHRVHDAVFYRDGEVVKTAQGQPSGWHALVPGSLGEALSQGICTG